MTYGRKEQSYITNVVCTLGNLGYPKKNLEYLVTLSPSKDHTQYLPPYTTSVNTSFRKTISLKAELSIIGCWGFSIFPPYRKNIFSISFFDKRT